MIPKRPKGEVIRCIGPCCENEPRIRHEHAVAKKAMKTLQRIMETHDNDSTTWCDLYDLACDAVDEILDSGWEP